MNPMQQQATSHAREMSTSSTMNGVSCKDDGIEACARCGKHGSDTLKLKNCTACRIVKYCGVDCQKAHRKQHKKACKQRAAELKDEQLYSQGLERPEGDFCPICTLPIPIPMEEHSTFNECCMKTICHGCDMAVIRHGCDMAAAAKIGKIGMAACVFCRTPCPESDPDCLAMVQARAEKRDPEAIYNLGEIYFHGNLGLQKDVHGAIELWTEAADLGSAKAIFSLGVAYSRGDGVGQDKAKGVHFYERAAMKGHAESRHNLGCYEGQKGNHGRAVRHLLISAKMGYKNSVDAIKSALMRGLATKEQYAEALTGYQDAVEETKSHDRDEAKRLAAEQKMKSRGRD